ncbi:SMI1/KNR4 family protein [Streptosporangium lutulentum]
MGTAGGEPDGRESDSCPEEAYGVTPGGEVGVATTAVGCVFNDVFPWTGSDGEASGDVSLEILNGAGAADGDRAEEEPVPVREPVTDADCRPEVREPRARAVSPTVTRAVNRQWRRIETWLKTNAPKTRLTLGEPAKARTIAVAEAQMGLRFPDDLRASLLRHNGAVFARDTRAFGFLGHENQDVRAIRDHWRGLCEIDGGEEGDPRSGWWDGRMIPFGADGSGDHLVIDSAVRDVGETDHEGQLGFTPGEIRIGSYYALLKATANALETGGSVGYWKPEAVDGELEWNIPDKS